MPGGSSATKEEPTKSGPPLSLLGATGSTGQDDQATDPIMGSRTVSPATTTVAEGACWWEKYSLLVCIFTARDRRSLEPHAWVEDLLKDFFQLILGINLSVILLSPTECLIFCGNRTVTIPRARACLGMNHSITPTNWWAYTLGPATW